MANRYLWTSIGALTLAAAASPACAAEVIEPPVVAPCDKTLTAPDAQACAGYYDKNLLGNSAQQIADQKGAIHSLPGDFEFDGNWAAVEATKVEALVNGNQINFGNTLFGLTVVGAHFGNVAGDAGNVTVFWQFDFGTQGAQFISLDDTQGFSNSVLYTTGTPAVPEPMTWMLMLLGFGAIGLTLRKRPERKLGSATA